MELLYQSSSPHHELFVYETTQFYGEKGRFRLLEFSDNAMQGALDMNDPERILFEYPRAMIHLLEYNQPRFEQVFIIGHGIGTLTSYFSDKRCKVAELDHEVVELSKKFFGYRGDPVCIGDGRILLGSEPQQAYDCLILDAFSEKGTPVHLISHEFFMMCREKLDASGMLMMNLFGKGEHDPLINAIHTTLNGIFTYVKAFLLPSGHRGHIQNIILIGRQTPFGFQARQMAGFTEIELGEGYTIRDRDPL
ncbi:spermidine synthase [Paenibacillus hexagrammi]|uniref:Fused MFS/spermidine synthase n=1 Tax=Paenibacillus hexagrammi TaxID=2908839 RepID=A0ABY3SR28_9BACL|nr:fused MFS/spermidine synthase [Paenibacillus sp. YPD9-1]UJF35709.1 fused MFS/spermidine synthase [Paenibacillus sp. YPD9-1]